jgi:hypothetical protein
VVVLCSGVAVQEPSGPEAEAAMAGLEVEVRCYKHVQQYTLAELSTALEHLEGQQAAGQGTGSWSDEQLEALRDEVARSATPQPWLGQFVVRSTMEPVRIALVCTCGIGLLCGMVC